MATNPDHPLIGKALIAELRRQIEDERAAHQTCVEMRNEAEAERDRLKTFCYELFVKCDNLGGFAERLKAKRSSTPAMIEYLANSLDPQHADFIGYENFGKWLGSYYSEIRDALRSCALSRRAAE